MPAQYLNISAKHRRITGLHASLTDFSVTPGEAVGADVVCADPALSLYCLDPATRQAIFVELPPEVDLARAPLFYLTQYLQARRLLAVPFDTFRELARELPTVERLIMIYMTGRSGSTLLSHLLNTVDSVRSFSEPDVATHFVHLRRAEGLPETELRELLDGTVRFLLKPTPFKAPSVLALKLRSEGTQLMELFQASFPQARNLFSYRDAFGFVRSFYRILTRDRTPAPAPVDKFVARFRRFTTYDVTPLLACLDPGTTALSTVQFLTVWWMAAMEWYLAQQARGIPALAIRYDDLNSRREQVVSAVFQYCGLSTAAVPQALGVFTQDAHAGTPLARDDPDQGNQLQLSEEQCQEILRILKRHSVIQAPDFVVPGTLHV
ncbi:MAG: hypothetical protein ACJ76N_25850 [Thermoanaerobaculia bacterium]